MALCAIVFWESLQLGLGTSKHPGAGFFPFFVGLVLFAFSLTILLKGWNLRESKKPHPRKILLALLFICIYPFILEPLGFTTATFLLIGVFLHLGGPRPWWALLGLTFLFTFLFHVVFKVLLHVYFPRGFLGI